MSSHSTCTYVISDQGHICITIETSAYESVIKGIFKHAYACDLEISFSNMWYYIYNDIEYTNVNLHFSGIPKSNIEITVCLGDNVSVHITNEIIQPQVILLRILNLMSFEEDTF